MDNWTDFWKGVTVGGAFVLVLMAAYAIGHDAALMNVKPCAPIQEPR